MSRSVVHLLIGVVVLAMTPLARADERADKAWATARENLVPLESSRVEGDGLVFRYLLDESLSEASYQQDVWYLLGMGASLWPEARWVRVDCLVDGEVWATHRLTTADARAYVEDRLTTDDLIRRLETKDLRPNPPPLGATAPPTSGRPQPQAPSRPTVRSPPRVEDAADTALHTRPPLWLAAAGLLVALGLAVKRRWIAVVVVGLLASAAGAFGLGLVGSAPPAPGPTPTLAEAPSWSGTWLEPTGLLERSSTPVRITLEDLGEALVGKSESGAVEIELLADGPSAWRGTLANSGMLSKATARGDASGERLTITLQYAGDRTVSFDLERMGSGRAPAPGSR